MSMRITVPGVVADNPLRYLKRVPPPVDGFASFLFTSDDIDRALVNVVAGGAAASAVGDPTVSTSAAFTNGNYIDTGVLETASMTFAAVVQRNNQQVMFMGSSSSADSNGARFYTNGASPRKPVADARYSVSTGVAVSAARTWPDSPTAYEAVFCIFDPDDLETRLYIPRTGELVEVSNSGARALSGRNICLGPGPSPATAYSGDTVVFKAAGVATRVLTTGECDDVYDWLKLRIAGI